LKLDGLPLHLTRTRQDLEQLAQTKPAVKPLLNEFACLQHKSVTQLATDESVPDAVVGTSTKNGNKTGLGVQLDPLSPAQLLEKQQQRPREQQELYRAHLQRTQRLGRDCEKLVTELRAPRLQAPAAGKTVTTFARVYDSTVAAEVQDMVIHDIGSDTTTRTCLRVLLRPHTDNMSWTASGHEVQLGRTPAIKAGVKLYGESTLVYVLMDARSQLPVLAVGIPMGPGTVYMMTGTLATGMPGDHMFWLHGVVSIGEAEGWERDEVVEAWARAPGTVTQVQAMILQDMWCAISIQHAVCG
jgi:hypothetical protein